MDSAQRGQGPFSLPASSFTTDEDPVISQTTSRRRTARGRLFLTVVYGFFYVVCTRWIISLLNDVSDLGGMVGLIYCYREFILGFSPLHSLFHVFKFGLPVLTRMKFSFPSSKKQLLGVWWSLGDFMCNILRGGFSLQIWLF